MPRPTKGARLASGPSHQKHLIRGMIASLIIEDRIQTTEAKAKLVVPYVDKLVTLGKTDTLHARRQALRWIEDDDIVHKLFAEIAPRFHDRNGGYTRVLKLGPRHGDAAPMAILEFVEESSAPRAGDTKEEAAARKRRLGRRKSAAASDDAPKAKSRARKATKETAPADDESAEDEEDHSAEPVSEATEVDEAAEAPEGAGSDEEPDKA